MRSEIIFRIFDKDDDKAEFLRDEGKSDVLLQLSLSVRNDLLAYKLMIYSVLSRIETFWVCTALAFCAAHSMLLFSIPSHP